MHKVVFDIETKNGFGDRGSANPQKLEISLLVVYEYDTDTFHSFMEPEFPKLWKLLEKTDLMIGFNSDYFDIPVLNRYYPGDLTKIKSLDLLSAVYKSLGRRVSLDMLAAGTLGIHKSGKGLDAITWWKNGEIEKLRQYCTDDVRITRDIYEYALRHKALKYKLGPDVHTVPIDTTGWDEKVTASLNYTLPF
ncbi:MAG: ribonuclease H-like domain-containing protein [Candidatus Kerfeldbacteria bacterium]|nr:ribonuclease H-like domain-containing protein [Candidatus Kerfeldbacteria bacterium]